MQTTNIINFFENKPTYHATLRTISQNHTEKNIVFAEICKYVSSMAQSKKLDGNTFTYLQKCKTLRS